MKVPTTILVIVLVAASLFAGCGKDKEQSKVEYKFEGNRVVCLRCNDSSEFSMNDYHSFTCVWYCSEYRGQHNRYVSLTFVDGANGWYLESEYVSGGICDSGKMPTAPQ